MRPVRMTIDDPFIVGVARLIGESNDQERTARVAKAMQEYRAAHINEPLARLWQRLAEVAVGTK
jgi:hypothetical protein